MHPSYASSCAVLVTAVCSFCHFFAAASGRAKGFPEGAFKKAFSLSVSKGAIDDFAWSEGAAGELEQPHESREAPLAASVYCL
jgi:hypothetical protein